MKNLRLCVLCFGMICLFSAIAFSQSADVMIAPSMSFPTMLNVPFTPCTPFSATVLSQTASARNNGQPELVQWQGRVMRDAAARTRVEFEIPGAAGKPGSEMIIIQDPTLQLLISLNPQQKTADVHRSGNIQAEATCPVRSAQAVSSGAATTTQHFSDGSTMTTEDLGSSSVDGFGMVGSRRTLTHPDGQSLMEEDWYSPELSMQLLKTQIDSHSNQRVLKLQELQAGEPDAALFLVPPDYTVHEERAQD